MNRRLSGETAADNDSIGIEFRFVVPPLVSHKYLNYLCAAWQAQSVVWATVQQHIEEEHRSKG
jgi:hypothetical protein